MKVTMCSFETIGTEVSEIQNSNSQIMTTKNICNCSLKWTFRYLSSLQKQFNLISISAVHKKPGWKQRPCSPKTIFYTINLPLFKTNIVLKCCIMDFGTIKNVRFFCTSFECFLYFLERGFDCHYYNTHNFWWIL